MRDDGSILPVSIVLFFPLFFPFLFSPSVFLPQFFSLFPPYPLPLPTPEDFFPTSNLNLWIFHGSLHGSDMYITNQSLKILVVEGG